MDQSLRERFREDGAVLLKNALNPDQLAKCREAFDWAVENPGPFATQMFSGELKSHVDNANPLAKDKLDALIQELPFGQIFADLWGSEHVWYYAEEVFLKSGGKSARTSFHQDTSYLPWAGSHWGNAWITFEPVPKKNALEIVPGSHRGVQYDGTTFTNPDDPTDPLHGEAFLPRLPAIDADLAQDPTSHEILSWATEPGDVILLHPHSLHGGAAVDADFPERHTLVFRFFGDDATFRELPDTQAAREVLTLVPGAADMIPGQPYRSPLYQRVH